MSRPLIVLGNVHRSSFILLGRHNPAPWDAAHTPAPFFLSHHYDLPLKELRRLQPADGTIVYHAYLPRRQIDLMRASWGEEVALHPVTYADTGHGRAYAEVPAAFLRVMDNGDSRPSHLTSGAWDLWLRAQSHATLWLGPAREWSAYEDMAGHGPLPPPPGPQVSYRAVLRRWKKELVEAVTERVRQRRG